MGTVGIVASPAAGKDVRRLVANAGSVGDVDKIAKIRRAAVGAIEGGASRLLYLNDSRHLVARALEESIPSNIVVEALAVESMNTGRDSVRAAEAFAKAEVGAVMIFGGDGTSRDVAKGWSDAPIVPMAVGTNNAFPLHLESTLGGLACGLIAAGVVDLEEVSERAKVIHVQIEDQESDLALVDVSLLAGNLIGSRAIWRVEDLRAAVFAISDPASVGLSSIGAAVIPTTHDDDNGVFVAMGQGAGSVRAAIAPGTYAGIDIAEYARLSFGEPVAFRGPGVLAFDGERDHILTEGQEVSLIIRRDGPCVIDPMRAARLASKSQYFHTSLS